MTTVQYELSLDPNELFLSSSASLPSLSASMLDEDDALGDEQEGEFEDDDEFDDDDEFEDDEDEEEDEDWEDEFEDDDEFDDDEDEEEE